MTIDEYAAGFDAEPGYLDYARVGPVSRAVEAEAGALLGQLAKARFGTIDSFQHQDARVRGAVARLTGLRDDQVAFQPDTSTALMHALFGLTGGVALSPAEFPSLTFAAQRASQTLGSVTPLWLQTDHGHVTPGELRDQLTSTTVAVAVSLVDFRTGYLVDLEGIRQVIGDRLLIVDAIQGFGVVDAPWSVADIIACGGKKWLRAGYGTGFLGLSDRALDHLTPVFSGWSATDDDGVPVDAVPAPSASARAFGVTHPDPIAQARLATALELVESVGVVPLGERVRERAGALIALADEFGLAVESPRADAERAGIVVVRPAAAHLTLLTASLHNHGVSATVRDGAVRFSAHAGTSDETLDMVRASFVSFASAATV